MEKTFGQRVRERREQLGLSQAELAERANTTQQSIDRIERDAVARSRSAPEVAAALGIDFPLTSVAIVKDGEVAKSGKVIEGSAHGGTSSRRMDSSSADDIAIAAHPASLYNPVPAEQLVGMPDLPIYASVRGGSVDDSVLVSPDPIDYVKRPEPLARAKNGYGLYIVGDSMEPVFRQGDLALIHPNMPPKPGDEVVVCSQDINGEHYAIIKQLMKVTASHWHLRQYNPAQGEPAEFTLDRKEWPVCHLVVGSYRKR